MTNSKDSFATIDHLPVELLSYIFVLGTQVQPSKKWFDLDEDWDTRPYLNNLPTSVARVSRRWRKIALSTVALWTSVGISLRDIRHHVAESPRRGALPRDMSRYLDTRRLDLYITHSQSAPIDILIDARDPHWDYIEPEPPNDLLNWNAFLPADMRGALSYLLQSMHRWRSLTILTDIWPPMYAALRCLNDFQDVDQLSSEQPQVVAPMLESLTLMRCNIFACYSPIFFPEELRDPPYLPFGGQHERRNLLSCLPKLNRLILSGVHLDWTRIAPSPSGGVDGPRSLPLPSYSSLQTLELSYHCRDVRPTLRHFIQMLKGCAGLSKLILRATGPLLDIHNASDIALLESVTISLERLRTLCIGYMVSRISLRWMKMISAPELRNLEIEDANHPIDFGEHDGRDVMAWLSGTTDDRSVTTADANTLPFPKLETLKLRHLHIERSEPVANLLARLPHLQNLSMDSTGYEVMDALNYRSSSRRSRRSHICPGLARLHVRADQDILDIVKRRIARRAADGLELDEVNLELFGQGRDVSQELEADVVALASSVGADLTGYFDDVDIEPIPEEEETDDEENVQSVKQVGPGGPVWLHDYIGVYTFFPNAILTLIPLFVLSGGYQVK
ncbi:hypothetical protein NEOLEDRAFT_349175 [Neolentinus lepideus HHB14362 ss-1]|uniref:Uncharacterized protein n=1 Tax=Neolentinus lepideus HHB14362 ss-1 TaxID=1314782 RepID=A0A165SRC9_9AGAM|nr:hypothetical protein NEOLEDRAFT_349175 [Neolentinus lepideus HHB14362 ss-1]